MVVYAPQSRNMFGLQGEHMPSSSVPVSAGAMYAESSDVFIDGRTTFSDNAADDNGGKCC